MMRCDAVRWIRWDGFDGEGQGRAKHGTGTRDPICASRGVVVVLVVVLVVAR